VYRSRVRLGVICAGLAASACGRIGFDAVGSGSNDDPSSYRGDPLFVELFDDAQFSGRGWYDGENLATITTTEHAPGSPSSLQCPISAGQSACAPNARVGRIQFAASEAIFISYWMKLDRPDPGPMFVAHLFTDADGTVPGPNMSYLTAFLGHDAGALQLKTTDVLGVDKSCVKLTSGTVLGCGGNFDTYPFTEARSVCACNGLVGPVDGWDCSQGGSDFASERWWTSAAAASPGHWHLVETYLRMSTIAGGVGRADGAVRLWFDGALAFSSDQILFRTGAHPTMAWNQLFLDLYRFTAASVDQTVWIDDLEIARGR